jgi:transcriptional regulator with XRE-family HTH domain
VKIGERLKLWRAETGLGQKEFSTHLGVSFRTYQKYEMGSVAPGAEAMEIFAKAGLNTNWLLTGEGPMLRKDLSEAGGKKPEEGELSPSAAAFAATLFAALKAVNAPINQALLEECIKRVEEHLKSRRQTLPIDKKALLVILLYGLFINKGKANDTTIASYIDLAS